MYYIFNFYIINIHLFAGPPALNERVAIKKYDRRMNFPASRFFYLLTLPSTYYSSCSFPISLISCFPFFLHLSKAARRQQPIRQASRRTSGTGARPCLLLRSQQPTTLCPHLKYQVNHLDLFFSSFSPFPCPQSTFSS